ncbi:MAG: hypothetical protein ACI8W8_001752 [Rhodothermales bacterium]
MRAEIEPDRSTDRHENMMPNISCTQTRDKLRRWWRRFADQGYGQLEREAREVRLFAFAFLALLALANSQRPMNSDFQPAEIAGIV